MFRKPPPIVRSQSSDSTDYKIEQHSVPKPAVSGTQGGVIERASESSDGSTRRRAAQRRVDELRERSNELSAAVDEVAVKLKNGNAVDNVNSIGAEKREVDQVLREAEGGLAAAERELEAATTAERHERFQTLTDDAQSERLDFIDKFREACLSLGRYCQSAGAAGARQ
jgi:seryl-tRNA synthetase